ncbi:MAG: hypothetical protein HC850_12805 [Rhodomicrobium sp.]|nr:hypothetical protein [Rhodomicrobium sp.]
MRDALQAAQIRELLRAARNGQQAEGVNRTQKILLAYNVFMRHYQEFDEEEKEMMTFLVCTPSSDITFSVRRSSTASRPYRARSWPTWMSAPTM